jgi:hypothetical protein
MTRKPVTTCFKDAMRRAYNKCFDVEITDRFSRHENGAMLSPSSASQSHTRVPVAEATALATRNYFFSAAGQFRTISMGAARGSLVMRMIKNRRPSRDTE